MGLDMYLYKRHYISPYDRSPSSFLLTKQVLELLEPDIKVERITRIDEQVAYWRKANEIHCWFVMNVQGGEDDCHEYDVSLEQLAELRDLVRQVIAEPDQAKELLPTSGGFFFGSTEYDADYFDDLRQTDETLTALIDEGCDMNSWFIYRASW